MEIKSVKTVIGTARSGGVLAELSEFEDGGKLIKKETIWGLFKQARLLRQATLPDAKVATITIKIVFSLLCLALPANAQDAHHCHHHETFNHAVTGITPAYSNAYAAFNNPNIPQISRDLGLAGLNMGFSAVQANLSTVGVHLASPPVVPVQMFQTPIITQPQQFTIQLPPPNVPTDTTRFTPQ